MQCVDVFVCGATKRNSKLRLEQNTAVRCTVQYVNFMYFSTGPRGCFVRRRDDAGPGGDYRYFFEAGNISTLHPVVHHCSSGYLTRNAAFGVPRAILEIIGR